MHMRVFCIKSFVTYFWVLIFINYQVKGLKLNNMRFRNFLINSYFMQVQDVEEPLNNKWAFFKAWIICNDSIIVK
jgi:hypothetical protein